MFLFQLLPSSRILTHLNIVQVTGKIAFLLYCFSDVFCNQNAPGTVLPFMDWAATLDHASLVL